MLHNPWGLLALLALPAILALHFFRSRHVVRRVGGLHLWQEAATRQPAGRQRQRLLRSLALLFELLAATLLALLIAGLDWPHARSERHYTLILDDSASMTAVAPGQGSVAERARALLNKWAAPSDRFTLVAAGLRPRVLAGPFATHGELLAALGHWQPEAPAADVGAALNLASKFLEEGQRTLLLTDDARPWELLTEAQPKGADLATTPPQPRASDTNATSDAVPAQAAAPLLEVAALGRPAENLGIVLADRLRVAAMRDRLVLVVQSWAARPIQPHLQATIGGQAIYDATLSLAPGERQEVRFETPETGQPIVITLPSDALAADNQVTLLPVRTKPVRVARIGLEGLAGPLARAIAVVPEAMASDDPAAAELVWAEGLSAKPSPATRVFVRLPHAAALGEVTLEQGENFTPDAEATLLQRVGFEGVLWPAFRDLSITTGGLLRAGFDVPLRAGTVPLLLTQELPAGADGAPGLLVAFNLKWRQSNLTRQPAWPMLMQALVEAARERMPGPARANFRAGEAVPLQLAALSASVTTFTTTTTTTVNAAAARPLELRRNGVEFARYEQPPLQIEGLPPGDYQLQREGQLLAEFRVNLLAAAEGDLQTLEARTPDLSRIETAAVSQAGTDPLLFFILLSLLIACVGGAWTCQDRSR